MEDTAIIKVKCPLCEKEFGISPNAFDLVDTVKFTCWDGCVLFVTLDKKTKTLSIKQDS